MKFRRSIQQRVVVIFCGFTLLLTIFYSALSIIVAYVVEDTVLENVLDQEAQYIQRTFLETGRIVPTRLDYVQLYQSPNQAPDDIARAYSEGSNASEVYGTSGRHYHIQRVNLDSYPNPLLVADVTSLLAVRNMSRQILVLFSIALLLASVLAIWLAYRIAFSTTKPIVALAQFVMEQRNENNEEHTDSADASEPANNEIDFLAQTVQSTLGQLHSLLKRESEFNRDLSHELRTPLTIMLNTLSLSDSRPLTASCVKQLNDAASSMKQVVESLLALARAESTSADVFAIKPLLEDCIVTLYPKLKEREFAITLSGEDFKVTGNKQLVMLVINNLIENAIAHASQQSLEIKLMNNALTFSNSADSTGLPDPTEPKAKQHDSEGIGQGLFLVKRILEALSWQYYIVSNERSFQFVVTPTLAD